MKKLIITLCLSFLLFGCTSTPTNHIEQPLEKVYVGSANSDKYHKPSCEWAQKIKPENEVWFSSKEEAAGKGYKACKVCSP